MSDTPPEPSQKPNILAEIDSEAWAKQRREFKERLITPTNISLIGAFVALWIMAIIGIHNIDHQEVPNAEKMIAERIGEAAGLADQPSGSRKGALLILYRSPRTGLALVRTFDYFSAVEGDGSFAPRVELPRLFTRAHIAFPPATGDIGLALYFGPDHKVTVLRMNALAVPPSSLASSLACSGDITIELSDSRRTHEDTFSCDTRQFTVEPGSTGS